MFNEGFFLHCSLFLMSKGCLVQLSLHGLVMVEVSSTCPCEPLASLGSYL